MQQPLNPARSHDTPALAWARRNLGFAGDALPARAARSVRRAPARIPRKWRLPAAIGGALVLAIVVFCLVFQWNWLRGPLAHYLSGRMNREVAITGDLEVHPWSLSPWARVHGLTVGEPAWVGKGHMAELPRLTVQVKVLPLLKGHVILPLVEASRPRVHLMRDAKGRANWALHPDEPPKPLKLPPIHRFIIDDGALNYEDAKHHLTFVGTVSSNERATGAGRGRFLLEGRGLLNQARFFARVTGGPLLNVSKDTPYPFNAYVEAGATRITAAGQIPHPFDLGQVSAQMHGRGPDMADLYYLTGLAFPSTPPYDLAASLRRDDEVYDLRRIHGRVGVSDLAGALKVDASKKKPMLTAELASRRLNFADFMAVFGGVPKHTAGHPLSPAQQAMSAKLRAEHRILPDAPLKTDRLKVMNARVAYRAESVDAGRLPVRRLVAKVRLQDSVLTFDPLSLVLPQGALAGQIRIDGRRAVAQESIDMRLTGARLESLVPARGGVHPIEGALLAHARLAGSGDSVRAAAANANGAVSVVIPRGQIRKALAELLGINATRGLFLLLTKDNSETPVRCAVADFRAQNGVLVANRIVLDTGVVLSTGHGQINLRDETVNLRLEGKSKKFRLVRVMAPITLKGRLAEPKVGVDIGKAAPQLGIAGLLGALVSPLAAVLPFIDPGLAKDADCSALIAEAHRGPAPVPARTASR